MHKFAMLGDQSSEQQAALNSFSASVSSRLPHAASKESIEARGAMRDFRPWMLPISRAPFRGSPSEVYDDIWICMPVSDSELIAATFAMIDDM